MSKRTQRSSHGKYVPLARTSARSRPIHPAPESYVLEIPGGEPTIAIDLDLVSRIRAHVLRTYDESGVETGGVLLGQISGTRVSVQAYETVSSDYRHDHLYLYSDLDKSRLAALADVASGTGHELGRSPVGFFRSNARGRFALADDDVSLMRDHFSDPGDICLLIDVTDRDACTGGVFVWEHGEIRRDEWTFEFPFDSRELKNRQVNQGSVWREHPPRRNVRPPERFVPSRRTLLPDFRKSVAWLAFLALAAAIGLGTAAYQRRITAPASKESIAARQRAPALDLRMERTGSQWRFIWNGSAAAINAQSQGRLSILDGISRKELTLSAAELQSGALTYIPSTDDVSFRLEVLDLEGRKSASEAIRVAAGIAPSGPALQLASNLYPSQSDDATAALKSDLPPQKQNGRRSAQRRSAVPRDYENPAGSPSKPEQADRASLETPVRAELAPRFREPVIVGRTTDIDLAPPPLFASHPVMVGMSDAVLSPAGQVPPPPANDNATATPSHVLPQALRRTSGEVRDPVLLRRVNPVYPRVAKATGVSGVVHVTGIIGKDGQMQAVQATRGPDLLRPAAVSAVQQWLYKPASIGHSPVQAPIEIDVVFQMGQ